MVDFEQSNATTTGLLEIIYDQSNVKSLDRIIDTFKENRLIPLYILNRALPKNK